MSSNQTKQIDHIHVPWRTVIFGGDLPQVDISALRRAQVRAVIRLGWVQIGTFVAAGFAILANSYGTMPLWAMALVMTAILLLNGLRYSNRHKRGEDWIAGTRGFAVRELMTGGALALSLTTPLLWAGSQGQWQLVSSNWLILCAAIALYGFASSSVPMLFVAVMPLTGALSALAFLLTGNLIGAVASAIFTAISTANILRAGRDYIQFELTTRQAAERGETVSMLLREFEDTTADWLWQIDANRRIIHASPRFAHAAGVEAEALEGTGFIKLLAGDSWESSDPDPAIRDLANKLSHREAFSGLTIPYQRGEMTRWWEISASPLVDGSGSFIGFRGVGSDVTEQRASAERIAHLARFDGLTGLPNRLMLNETLAGALEQAATWRRRCAFLMIDLDRFKAVNDTLGHPIGDRMLAQVASRLKALCGENIIAGRLGGDEFAVVIREVDSVESVDRLGTRIIEVISRPYEIDQHTLYVGASIGYAIGPRDGASVEKLTRNADLAMYRSKDRGGGLCNNYEPSLHDQARERREIEIELRSALERNEFLLNYQPVVHSDGHVDGFEALLRWNNRKLGPVSPVKFVPVAEDSRLIGPIGEWVLQTACREAANWPDSTKVAVNVSAEQLSSPGFVSSVINALSHSGIRPGRLELEVTESVFLREVSGAMATLDQVRGLGIKLVLDDFGTGYSSLGYLRMGQFTTIKVDRSFVKGALTGNRESIAIIRAVVALADSLDMSTTAEGVETQDEADAIVALGCKKLQGYHFGRPMPAEDARAIFGAYNLNRAVG